jgi:hypothetical protein
MRVEKRFGKEIIILEEGDFGVIWIEKENLFKMCEEIFEDVKSDPNHPLRGKTLLQAIMQDAEDRLGWRKYLPQLKELLKDELRNP